VIADCELDRACDYPYDRGDNRDRSDKSIERHELKTVPMSQTKSRAKSPAGSLFRSIISLLDIPRTFAAARAMWTIEHDGTGGAELPFVLGKTKRHPTYIRHSVLAKTKRIRGAGIRILLRVSQRRERGQDHN
jgi:hypothetical protein